MWKRSDVLAPLEAAKWMRYPVKMSEEKLKNLLDHLDCHAINISKVLSEREFLNGRECFEEAYHRYLEGDIDRASLSIALTKNAETIGVKKVGEGRYIARPLYPVVQIALFTYSISNEGKILPHALGKNAIPFGIEFSYPSIYRDPKTEKIENGMLFEAASLWKECTRFLREGFELVKLKVGEEMVATSFRSEIAL